MVIFEQGISPKAFSVESHSFQISLDCMDDAPLDGQCLVLRTHFLLARCRTGGGFSTVLISFTITVAVLASILSAT